MLAAFMETPRTPEDVAAWSFGHQVAHVDIQRVLFTQRNVQVPLFALDPLRPSMDWVYQNQEQHSGMAKALGYKGYDLTAIDWQDPESVVQWMALHFEEHQIAAQILGLP